MNLYAIILKNIFLLSVISCLWACSHVRIQPSPQDDPFDRVAVLGPGDVLEVRIYNEPELSGDHQVDTLGYVRLPLAGSLAVSGLSIEEASVQIAKKYEEKYIKDAEVTVFVKEFNSRKVFVLGRVNKPGPYPYEEGMTIIGAIARAEGVHELAAPNKTVLTRRIDGASKRIVVKAKDIGRGIREDILVRPGDIIFIPESFF